MEKQEKKKGKIIYKIIILVLLIIIGVCIYKIVGILSEYHEGTKAYEQLQLLAGIEDMEDIENINFKALRKQNKDVKAWLYSEGTVINYPVVQGDDNSYYLYRMVNGEWNGKGSLFIDYRVEKPFRDFNTIIYGHRMKDGSMFHSLIEYEDKGYYEQHPVMNLITPNHKYDVEIFGVIRIPADSPMYKCQFDSYEEKANYLAQIKKNSLINIDEVEVSAEDRIVMLSTCTYEFEDARMVVYGKLVEKEEDGDK
ncbi:MAG: class B sortase [Emergencia sp.]|nr:class B sortase [Emergencia sp.]MCI9638773.1 class B sortase [Emergencia sp.]